MLILESSSYILEIPNDAYTTLSQNLIGCSTLSQEYCQLIGLYWKIMTTLNINMLYQSGYPHSLCRLNQIIFEQSYCHQSRTVQVFRAFLWVWSIWSRHIFVLTMVLFLQTSKMQNWIRSTNTTPANNIHSTQMGKQKMQL